MACGLIAGPVGSRRSVHRKEFGHPARNIKLDRKGLSVGSECGSPCRSGPWTPLLKESLVASRTLKRAASIACLTALSLAGAFAAPMATTRAGAESVDPGATAPQPSSAAAVAPEAAAPPSEAPTPVPLQSTEIQPDGTGGKF